MICASLSPASTDGLRCGLLVPKILTALCTIVPLSCRILIRWCSLLMLLLVVGTGLVGTGVPSSLTSFSTFLSWQWCTYRHMSAGA